MIQIRLMTDSDLPLGMRLKDANGWNQTEADWRRYLDLQSGGCFVALLDDTPVGTLTTCIFGSVAWIAMVLVDAAFRGRGVGSQLMQHALEFLKEQGAATIRLDATPLGEPLYRKLGFVADYALHRYEGVLSPRGSVPAIEQMLPRDLPDILQLDGDVMITDRRKLLLRLASEFPQNVRVARGGRSLHGFCIVRPGARALQVGPCIAAQNAGRLLLEDVCHRNAGTHAYIDIPENNGLAIQWANEKRLVAQRRLLRMSRGPKLNERVTSLWASSGPEMG